MSSTPPLGELDEWLPFHENGTLEAPIRARIATELERSESARRELALCWSIRSELAQVAEAARPSEVEWRSTWQHVVQRLDAAQPMASSSHGQSAGLLAEVRSWALAAAVLLATLGASLAWQFEWPMPGGAVAENDTYRLAEGPRSGQIAVQFRDGATAAQIRDLLTDLQLGVVDGPSALGVYELRGTDRDMSPGELERAVDILHTHEIVSHAHAR